SWYRGNKLFHSRLDKGQQLGVSSSQVDSQNSKVYTGGGLSSNFNSSRVEGSSMVEHSYGNNSRANLFRNFNADTMEIKESIRESMQKGVEVDSSQNSQKVKALMSAFARRRIINSRSQQTVKEYVRWWEEFSVFAE